MLELTPYQTGLLLSIRRWQLREVPFTNANERYSHLEFVRIQSQFIPKSLVIWDAPFDGDFAGDDDYRLEAYELLRSERLRLRDTLFMLTPIPPFTFPLMSGGECTVSIDPNEHSTGDFYGPVLRIKSARARYLWTSTSVIDAMHPHVQLTWRGLELADSLIKKTTLIHVDRWRPPSGYVGVKEILTNKRYQKQGKSPPRTTIQAWEKSSPPVDRLQDQETQEVYFPTDWVMERWTKWNPRTPKRRT